MKRTKKKAKLRKNSRYASQIRTQAVENMKES
jgi:hypothetical protein